MWLHKKIHKSGEAAHQMKQKLDSIFGTNNLTISLKYTKLSEFFNVFKILMMLASAILKRKVMMSYLEKAM